MDHAHSLTYYPIILEVYVGKQSTSNKTEDLIMRLSQNLRPSHVLIGDKYFTSLKLSERLLSEQKIFIFWHSTKNFILWHSTKKTFRPYKSNQKMELCYSIPRSCRLCTSSILGYTLLDKEYVRHKIHSLFSAIYRLFN